MALSRSPAKSIEARPSTERRRSSVFMSFFTARYVHDASGSPQRRHARVRGDVSMRKRFEGVRRLDADGSIPTVRIERHLAERAYPDLAE
jgi:hypothetical protein